MGYTWAQENCPSANFVLKTDDDTFVDVTNLEFMLDKFEFHKNVDFFYLCQVLVKQKVYRDHQKKWYLSKEDYEKDEFPPYCAGPVYLTNIPTIQMVLQKVKKLPFLFIDDVLLTGIAAEGAADYFHWNQYFLNNHNESAAELFDPKDRHYFPELMAAFNLEEEGIRIIHKKYLFCVNEPEKCYGSLWNLPEETLMTYFYPKKLERKPDNVKDEL